MYPNSFIYFGILHGLALMLIVVRCTAHWGRWLWPLGALAVSLPWLAPAAHQAMPALEVFNTPALNWIGLISRKPITEDYAPLLPWLGVMWWGMAAGRRCIPTRPQWLAGDSIKAKASAFRPAHQLVNGLARLGRWSLSYYMVHQPLLIGALGAWAWLSRG